MTSYDQFNTYYEPEEWQRCQNNWDEYIDFRDKRRRKKHDYKIQCLLDIIQIHIGYVIIIGSGLWNIFSQEQNCYQKM